LLSECTFTLPKGWDISMEKLAEVTQLAVDTCIWPMYEVEKALGD
jgi:pyruvate ferredoxin oxidoreductase beta subunit